MCSQWRIWRLDICTFILKGIADPHQLRVMNSITLIARSLIIFSLSASTAGSLFACLWETFFRLCQEVSIVYDNTAKSSQKNGHKGINDPRPSFLDIAVPNPPHCHTARKTKFIGNFPPALDDECIRALIYQATAHSLRYLPGKRWLYDDYMRFLHNHSACLKYQCISEKTLCFANHLLFMKALISHWGLDCESHSEKVGFGGRPACRKRHSRSSVSSNSWEQSGASPWLAGLPKMARSLPAQAAHRLPRSRQALLRFLGSPKEATESSAQYPSACPGSQSPTYKSWLLRQEFDRWCFMIGKKYLAQAIRINSNLIPTDWQEGKIWMPCRFSCE